MVGTRKKPALSIAIPAHNEEKYIGRCIESILSSAQRAGKTVEVVVALNRCVDQTRTIAESLGARCIVNDTKCIAAVRNAAVRDTAAAAVATIDADDWMAPETISAVLKLIYDPNYIGGGAMVRFERVSLGILFSLLASAPYLARHRVSAGMFWFLRETFEAIGGFNESLVSAEDLDFARRLKAYGKTRGKRYGTIWRHGIVTSCRKFDRFGDWYFFRNPRVVKEIFKGTNRKVTDQVYYDVDR